MNGPGLFLVRPRPSAAGAGPDARHRYSCIGHQRGARDTGSRRMAPMATASTPAPPRLWHCRRSGSSVFQTSPTTYAAARPPGDSEGGRSGCRFGRPGCVSGRRGSSHPGRATRAQCPPPRRPAQKIHGKPIVRCGYLTVWTFCFPPSSLGSSSQPASSPSRRHAWHPLRRAEVSRAAAAVGGRSCRRYWK